jgi:hypothetical protein
MTNIKRKYLALISYLSLIFYFCFLFSGSFHFHHLEFYSNYNFINGEHTSSNDTSINCVLSQVSNPNSSYINADYSEDKNFAQGLAVEIPIHFDYFLNELRLIPSLRAPPIIS